MTPKRVLPNGSVIYDWVTDEEETLLSRKDPGMTASPLPARAMKHGARDLTIELEEPTATLGEEPASD